MAIIPWLKKIFFLCQALSVTIDHKSICHINGNKTRGVCSLKHHTRGFCSAVIAVLGCWTRWSLPWWSREGSTALWHWREWGEESRTVPSITGVTKVTAASWHQGWGLSPGPVLTADLPRQLRSRLNCLKFWVSRPGQWCCRVWVCTCECLCVS